MSVRLLKSGHSNNTVFVLGGTGSGKTTLIANLVDERERFVLFDTRNEYDPEFFSGQIAVVTSPGALQEALNAPHYRIIYKLGGGEMADQELEAALYIIYHFQAANRENEDLPPIAVVLDELNRFAETHNWPDTLQEMVQRGRDFRIDKIFGAQWFGTIPTWCRDSFSEIYAFRHSDKNGLVLLERFGFDPDDVKMLPAYTALHTGKDGIEKIRLTLSK